ncbi:MAG TPA: hypothetical protein VN946_13645 [Terriglobales bacterium]|jgi:hypothetical protein|nr:hypothetical protein [Terriglobales bacterium]
MPASSLDPMKIPEDWKKTKVAAESTLFLVGLRVGTIAESATVTCGFWSLRGVD